MAEPGVLLISPGIIKWTDMDFGLPHLVSMGGYLRRETGVRVELLDLNYEGGDHEHLRRTKAVVEHIAEHNAGCVPDRAEPEDHRLEQAPDA